MAPNKRRLLWITWLTSFTLFVVIVSAVLYWSAPSIAIAELQVIGTAMPREMISAQRVTAFVLVNFGPNVERGWVRMEACREQGVRTADCLRWPIVPISPNSEGLWAGPLGHLGMHEVGNYQVAIRTYVDAGLDAPITSDSLNTILAVLNGHEQSQLVWSPLTPHQTGSQTCPLPFAGWRRVGLHEDDVTPLTPPGLGDSWTWSQAISLDSNTLLYACPPVAGTFHMTLDGTSALNRGSHAIVQAGGNTVFESLLDESPIRIAVPVPAQSPIVVAFVNDLYRPPEDRTLWISDLSFTPSLVSR